MKKNLEFQSYVEWYDSCYHTTTKVYDLDKVVNSYNGSHWDNPAIIKAEVVEGEAMSDEMSEFIASIGATEAEEADDDLL